MKTVLLVSASDALRTRLLRGLEDTHSVFTAASDDEALRTLRLTEMELIVKEIVGPSRDLTAFIASARHLCPTSVVVCIVTPGADTVDGESEAEAADFVLLEPFTSRQLQSLLKQADDKLAPPPGSRGAARGAESGRPGRSREPRWTGPRPPRRRRPRWPRSSRKRWRPASISRACSISSSTASAELARPSRAAILLADPESRHYRVAAYRGLAPHVVESLTLSADSGLPLWLATEGRLIQHRGGAEPTPPTPAAREIARELAVLQSVVAIPLSSHGELVGHPHPGSAHQRRRVWTERDRDPVQPRDPPGHRDPRHPRAPPAPVREGFQRADPRPHVERRDHHRARREGRGDQRPRGGDPRPGRARGAEPRPARAALAARGHALRGARPRAARSRGPRSSSPSATCPSRSRPIR